MRNAHDALPTARGDDTKKEGSIINEIGQIEELARTLFNERL